MSNKCYLNMGEVAKITGYKSYQINYLIEQGIIDEPLKISNRRCFSDKDIDKIKEIYKKRNCFKFERISVNKQELLKKFNDFSKKLYKTKEYELIKEFQDCFNSLSFSEE